MKLSQIISFGSMARASARADEEDGELFDDKTLESAPNDQRGGTVALTEFGYSSSYDTSSPVASRGDMLVW